MYSYHCNNWGSRNYKGIWRNWYYGGRTGTRWFSFFLGAAIGAYWMNFKINKATEKSELPWDKWESWRNRHSHNNTSS